VPFAGHAAVAAELLQPDGQTRLLVLHPAADEPGAFAASLVAVQSGIYRFRILAHGRTRREQRFTREATRTAAVWHGGDRPGQGGAGLGDRPQGGGGGGPDWCAILECLLGRNVLSERLIRRLAEAGFDIEHLRDCLTRLCGGKHKSLSMNERTRLLAQIEDAIRSVGGAGAGPA
jgi:hypothetical protein